MNFIVICKQRDKETHRTKGFKSFFEAQEYVEEREKKALEWFPDEKYRPTYTARKEKQ